MSELKDLLEKRKELDLKLKMHAASMGGNTRSRKPKKVEKEVEKTVTEKPNEILYELTDKAIAMADKIMKAKGVQEMMTNPIMSSAISTPKEEPQNQPQAPVVEPAKETPKESKKNTEEKKVSVKKNPLITKVSSGSETPLKVKDGAADILAKIANHQKKWEKFEKLRAKKDKKYRKELDDQKERFLEETIEALTGKKPSVVGRMVRKAKRSGFMKYGIMAAGAVGTFFLAEKALANVDWKSIIPGFGGGENGNAEGAGGLTFKQLNPQQQEALLDAQAKGEGANKLGTLPNRMNNPGALIIPKGGKIPDYAKDLGAELGENNEVGTMLKFPTMEKGREAQRRNWEKNYSDMPISDALSKWTTGKTGNKAPYESMVTDAITKAGPVPTASNKTPTAIKDMAITSDFGKRINPISGAHQEHEGIDIRGSEGQDVIAVSKGTVASITDSPDRGTTIVLDHGNGYTTTYRHLKNPAVSVGTVVERADKIGEIAPKLSKTTGPHLHLEVRQNGEALDPKQFLTFSPVAPKMIIQERDSQVGAAPKKENNNGGTKVSVLNNNTNVMNGGTTYQISQANVKQNSQLFDKQYG